MPIQRWYYVRCQHFISAHIRAYAIRPYTCSVEIRASLGENTITNRPIQSSCYHRINRKYVGAYRIRPPRRRTYQQKSLAQSDASLQIPLPLLFSSSLTSGRMRYAPTVFLWRRNNYILTSWFAQLFYHQRWAHKWETIICRASMILSRWDTMVWNPSKIHLPPAKWGLFFAQNGYRDCDGGRSPCANGHRICRNEIVPLTKWRQQMLKRYCPLRKPSSHLPKWNCPPDKVSSANAEAILSTAQTVIAFAEMKLSLRHWGFGNRDRTLHTLKTPSPHLRWKHCRQNKGQEANAKAVYAPCIRLYFMPDTPTNRPAKTIANVTTYK